jgi:hypothetical protein
MCDAPYPDLPPSDRLRLLTEELRHVGPEPWILVALDCLADELEEVEFAVRKALRPQDGGWMGISSAD